MFSSSLRNLFFYDLLRSTPNTLKLRSLFDVFILVTLSLLPIWIGFSWSYIHLNFSLENATQNLMDIIKNGELLIVSIGFSAPVFIYVTKRTPEHRIVNKQLLLYLTYFLSIFTLCVYLALKSLPKPVSDTAITVSVFIFLIFSFITFIANLANINTDHYGPQDATRDLSKEASKFSEGLDEFGDQNDD